MAKNQQSKKSLSMGLFFDKLSLDSPKAFFYYQFRNSKQEGIE